MTKRRNQPVYTPPPKPKAMHGYVRNAFNAARPLEYVGDYERQQSWEEIDELYQVFATGLVESGQYLGALVSYLKSSPLDAINHSKLSVIESGICKDLEQFTNELVAIRTEHTGRTGVISDPDDLAHCLDLFNVYSVFKDRMSTTLQTYAVELTSMSAELQAQFPSIEVA